MQSVSVRKCLLHLLDNLGTLFHSLHVQGDEVVMALGKKEGVAAYIEDVKKRYQVKFDKDPRVIEVEISDGAREI